MNKILLSWNNSVLRKSNLKNKESEPNASNINKKKILAIKIKLNRKYLIILKKKVLKN